ncbi:hypothetical protein V498_07348 [Pseudogymnoascus sp. VKM F-4517 (FW-2822)]|nr:hypothetical protein V498_07348 [Pseudogymnoascus sp. VKM F-4517 (FW-2822)]
MRQFVGLVKTNEDVRHQDYTPGAKEDSSKSDAESSVLDEYDLALNEYEVVGEDGTVKVFSRPVLTEEEALQEDERVVKAAAKDKRFKNNTNRRELRFSVVFERGKAALNLP